MPAGYCMSVNSAWGFRAFELAAGALTLLSAGAGMAQGRHLTAQDYARAERFMSYDTEPLVDHDVQHVHWLDERRFWYVDHDSGGDHFLVMTAATGKVAPVFDQRKLAGALAKAIGEPVAASKLAAFIRGWNLWVRDLATGRETQLTFDGTKDFGYATDNAGWRQSERPVLNWSADSAAIATYQQDQRNVGEMDLVRPELGHPRLKSWKYPLPGDQRVFMIEPVVIAVATQKIVRLGLPPQQRLSSLCDDISCKADG